MSPEVLISIRELISITCIMERLHWNRGLVTRKSYIYIHVYWTENTKFNIQAMYNKASIIKVITWWRKWTNTKSITTVHNTQEQKKTNIGEIKNRIHNTKIKWSDILGRVRQKSQWLYNVLHANKIKGCVNYTHIPLMRCYKQHGTTYGNPFCTQPTQ